MFDIDDRQIKAAEAKLKTFARKSIPFATRNTLNKAASTTWQKARANVEAGFVLRNKFTIGSIRYESEKRELDIDKQETRVGSIADYMEEQEFGGVKVKRGKHGVPIPTSFAAGQDGQKPRTRLPSRSNKLGRIQLTKTGTINRRPKNTRQATLFAVYNAVATKKRFIYLRLGRGTQGIFKVTGGRLNKSHRRGPIPGAKLRMVYDLSRGSVNIPANPWLSTAVDDVVPKIPRYYRESLAYQAKRNGLA